MRIGPAIALLAYATGFLFSNMAPARAVESAPADSTAPRTYADSLLDWRTGREDRLRAPTGWLAVAGLFWLSDGENTFGTDASNAIVLPEGSAPPRAGSFWFDADAAAVAASLQPAERSPSDSAPRASFVRVRAGAGVEMRVGDSLVTDRALLADDSGAPDALTLGRLQFTAIKRGERFAIRMRDPESAMRREFRGIDYYALDSEYRVEAKFTPFAGPPHRIEVPNIAGYADSMIVPGVVSFVINGNHLQLRPVLDAPGDSSFFFIFADATTEVETYGGGRFLYADLRPDNTLTIDFNKAYNPPCAFTPFTTCPMPPEGNRLPVPIRAGERKYESELAH
ncbi:MAG: DUF1684 domain-containing protein [bacterium]